MLKTTKPGKCKHCKTRLEKIGEKLHDRCVGPWYEANKAKIRVKALKAERRKDRECKKAANPPDYLALAQKVFNAWVRERDKDQPCICCGRSKTMVNGLRAHGWDAGHYRSRGSAPHLRFHEDNCHRQLVYCNQYRSGNAVDYRLGLIERIGLERVEALEADQAARHYTDDDYIDIAATYRAKLKALKAKE